MKLRKNDTIQVIAGKDKGKTGKVEKVLPKKNMVQVAGINLYKRHLKPQGQNKPGGIVDITKPINVSKIALVCPKCKQRTRIGYFIDKSNKKYRMCKKCQQIID